MTKCYCVVVLTASVFDKHEDMGADMQNTATST
jgi:hypothetical protein